MAFLRDDFWSTLLRGGTVCRAVDEAVTAPSHSTLISSCIRELEKMGEDLESKLHNDYNSILDSMSSLSLSSGTPHPSSPLTRSTSMAPNSPFTIAAYSWLLENISNPYPSSTVKASLAQQYSCAISAVNTWFVNARRRMGWTALCRNHFKKSRAEALDAAHRALVREDPNRPLPPEIIHAFIRVKVTVEDLYSAISAKSALADRLDAVVRDMTDQDAASTRAHNYNGVAGCLETLEVESQSGMPGAQYYSSSSDTSCSSSPVPALVESFTDESEEEEEVLPLILAGRKRRLSCSESAQDTTSTPKRRKPLLSDIPSLTGTHQPSIQENTQTGQLLQSVQMPENSTHVATARNGLLSDGNGAEVPKHPQEPLPPAVSDLPPLSPLESDHVLDQLFNGNIDTLFALPPPVDVVEPDLTAQWEVELFNGYNFPGEQPFNPLNSPVCYQESPSLDLVALENFIHSLDNGGPIPLPESVGPAITAPVVHLATSDPSVSTGSIDWDTLFNLQTSEPSLDTIRST